jgi:hypothetical protein
MEFNTNIEKLSTFTLLDKQGQKVSVGSIAVEEKKLKGTFKDPLPNGEYSVNWKIVGEDGHVIERGFIFTVKLPELVKETPTSSPLPTEQVQQIPAPQEKEQTNQTPPAQTAATSNNHMTLVWSGVGILLVLGVLVITLRRRK